MARPQAANTASTGTRSRGETDADSNLISTLLGIIRQDGGAAAEPSAMDSLVARILAENERTYSETNAALASLGVCQRGSRLSVQPVSAAHWKLIRALSKRKSRT